VTVRFSPQAGERFSEILSRYPKKEAALLPVLWLAQNEFGHLSPEVRAYVAGELGVSLAKVESVVSFYTLYSTKPVAKTRIQICRNISCRLRGSEDLSAWMEKEMGLSSGEKTPDGSVGCCTVECLAACGGAPAIRVNDDYYEKTGVKDLERVVGRARGTGGEDR
jgi:NADH-quinone oxidoreductase subunit E